MPVAVQIVAVECLPLEKLVHTEQRFEHLSKPVVPQTAVAEHWLLALLDHIELVALH